MLRLAQHGLMRTRLTDRCPGSHLSTRFATKAATNPAPSNRALALPSKSNTRAFSETPMFVPVNCSSQAENCDQTSPPRRNSRVFESGFFGVETAQVHVRDNRLRITNQRRYQLSYAGALSYEIRFSEFIKSSTDDRTHTQLTVH